jgi:predicted nucleic acid-binding protein
VTLVIDASGALKWYLTDEPETAEARAILVAGERLIAPDLIIAEVCNAALGEYRDGPDRPGPSRGDRALSSSPF